MSVAPESDARRGGDEGTEVRTIAPRVRRIGSRHFTWALVMLPLLAVATLFGVGEIARIERTLAAEGAKSVRVLVYELKPHEDLRVAIEPGTDVVRVVAHALRRGSMALTSHAAVIDVAARGDDGTRTEQITLAVPGTATRVTPEESDIAVGDPVGFDVDVHDVGVGSFVMSLAHIDDADALLVRVYRRESLGKAAASQRARTVEEVRHEHLAAHVWEIDWIDLDAAEQQAILGSRWRKIAAYQGAERDLHAHAIALAPAPPRPAERAHSRSGTVVASASLRGDEAIAITTKAKARLTAVVEDADVELTATLSGQGEPRAMRGKGELTIDAEADAYVEVHAAAPAARVSVRALDASAVSNGLRVGAWRATPLRPVIVTSGDAPIVLRVTARRPVARDESGIARMTLDVRVGVKRTTVSAERTRSRVDRFDGPDQTEAPTDRFITHVVVPAHQTATITPREPAVDIALAELDPASSPLPSRARPEGEIAGAARAYDPAWNGFVPRRPTNAAAYGVDDQVEWRLAPRIVVPAPPTGKPAIARVHRPKGAVARLEGELTYEPAEATFDFDTPAAAFVPIRLLANAPVVLIARVDGGAPSRKSGAAVRVTLDRTLQVPAGASRALVILGDDLAPGHHTLTFEVASGPAPWVHIPWTREKRPSSRALPAPHWITGDFDE